MPNAIKYSASAQTLSLKKGNFWIGTGDVDKGPTPTTGYYNGITPGASGYTIYLQRTGAPGELSYNSVANDSQLIAFTNGISGQSYTTAAQCLNYFATQTNVVCFNRDYEPIITDGLIVDLDAGFTPSYPTTGTPWYNLAGSSYNGSLVNGPTFNPANSGGIVFDGLDDYIDIPPISGPAQQTMEVFFNANSTSSKTILVGNPVYRPRISLRSNVVTVYYGMETGEGDINFTFSSISTSQWYQLVYTYGGSTNHKCYLNTVEGTRTSNRTALNGTPNFTNLALGISAGSEGYFNGQMSIFRLYNRALTQAEITQNFNAQKARFGL